MSLHRPVRRVLGTLLFAFALSPVTALGAEWKPEANVEIVVPSGPGSGLDTTGRALQKAIQENKLLAVPTIVMNKPGAGGTVAYQYLNQHPGNAHFISITSPGVVTNKIIGMSTIDFTELTPLAHLFDENIAFMVLPDSRIKDVKTLIALLKKDPGAITFGIATALGGANHIATASALKAAGVDIRNVRNIVYKSGGEVTIALLGGHVDVVPISAPIAVPQLQSGKVRVIAVSSPKRMGGALASVPTWRENGIDSTYSTWRGVVGPKGMSKEQIAYWDAFFAKVSAADSWKKMMEANGWVSNPLTSEQSRAFLERERQMHQTILSELGMAK